MTNRQIPPDRPGNSNRDIPTRRGYAQDPADRTMRADAASLSTERVDQLAWSQEGPQAGEQPVDGFRGDPYGQQAPYPQYQPNPQYQYGQYPQYQQPPQAAPVGPAAWDNAPQAPAARKTPVGAMVIAAAVVGVALLGGGLAYTLTGSS